MSKNSSFYPSFSIKLIDRLIEDFPNRLPEKQISDFELGYLIGQQSIIKKLQFEYDKAEKEDSPFNTE